ncbi:MAG TPA: pre-peptidase C-terminal domain-containing protein [Gemmataceae bacterium]|nr:pre-peptidase C-terminal domain-containing protein [Gemmataceae bacterium]
MNTFNKSLVALFGVMALMLSMAGLAAAQQPARWVKERIYEGLDKTTADAYAKEINEGSRGGEIKNASVVADNNRPGNFAVDADRFYAAENPTLATVVKTGDLVSKGPNAKDVVRYTVQLTPGARYTIELKSGTGATKDGKAMPGFFDSVLMVEDGTGNVLAANDDINWPVNCNSKVTITVPQSGTIRVVVSSYRNGEWGPFTVTMTPQ